MEKKLNQIIPGDTLEELKKFRDGTIDSVVTSPPYWALRDYSTEPQIFGGDPNCEHEWHEIDILRKATPGDKPGFNSKVAVHRTNKENRPGEPSDFCSKCGAWKGQLGLEPSFDLYLKHLCDIFDEVKRVLKNTGTCWVNLGDTYSGGGNTNDRFQKQGKSKSVGEYKFNRKLNPIQEKCLCLIPFRFAIEMVNRGWILRNVIIWWKPNCMPSSIKDRFTVDFEYVFFFVKNKKYWFEKQYEPLQASSLLRAKYNSYSSKTDQGIHGGMNLKNQLKVFEKIKNGELQGRNKRCVWRIPTRPFKGSHFAVFPETLVETPIKAGCPKSGIVLDPFMGSGTTAVVAKRLGRNYVGIELNPKYIEMAEKRIKAIPEIRRKRQ